jgi:hypothetical protein
LFAMRAIWFEQLASGGAGRIFAVCVLALGGARDRKPSGPRHTTPEDLSYKLYFTMVVKLGGLFPYWLTYNAYQYTIGV